MARVRTGRSNEYSAVPVPAAPKMVDGPMPPTRTLARTANAMPAPQEGETKAATARRAKAQKDVTEGRARDALTGSTTARRAEFEAAGGRAHRVDEVHPSQDREVGHGMRLSDVSAGGMMRAGVSPAHTLDAVRGTSMMADPAYAGTARAGSGEKVPRTVSQGTPNINEPHEVSSGTVPARRWEDMAPEEQAHTLRRVAMYGSSPEKMHADLRAQVMSAHARSGRNGVATPYSALFYEGPSAPHAKLEEGADELEKQGVPREVGRPAVVTANAATSPNVKFQQGQRFPNHEAAMHAIGHAMKGGAPEDVGRPAGVGGVYPANLEKAAHLATQQLGGAKMGDLKLQSGATAFDPSKAPKTTDYAGAWNEPVGPDSRYVSDVHSTHTLMPHLSTAKSVYHKLRDGREVALHPHDEVPRGAKPVYEEKNGKQVLKTSGSETEQYLAGDKVGLSALHDHVARNVAHELGLSHSPDNAGATHYLQASDWGEEQIGRSDIHDRTEATSYGRDARDLMRVPAGNERVSTGAEPASVSPFHRTTYVPPSQRGRATVSPSQFGSSHPDVGEGAANDRLERGIAARSAATVKKRGTKPAGDEHFDDDDPWAPRNQR